MLFKEHFIFVVTVLIMGNVASTIITFTLAGGDSGWWPLYFIILIVVSISYAFVFSLAASSLGIQKYPAGFVHIFVALTFVVLTVLFYRLPIDWLAVNSGSEMPTLAAFVHSDYTYYGLFLLGLLGSIIVGVFSKREDGN